MCPNEAERGHLRHVPRPSTCPNSTGAWPSRRASARRGLRCDTDTTVRPRFVRALGKLLGPSAAVPIPDHRRPIRKSSSALAWGSLGSTVHWSASPAFTLARATYAGDSGSAKPGSPVRRNLRTRPLGTSPRHQSTEHRLPSSCSSHKPYLHHIRVRVAK